MTCSFVARDGIAYLKKMRFIVQAQETLTRFARSVRVH
jgi:hypothetical protein